MTRAELSVNSRNLLATTAPDEDENEPREECGVFGVWAPGEDVAKLTYYGLYALQHRGQEAAGIAVADGSQVLVFKDLGLVSQVFDEQTLGAMPGHVAVGHCRYSTTGSTTWENAQPIFRTTAAGTGVALGHNGNLVNTAELAQRAREAGLVDEKRRGAATSGLGHRGCAARARRGRQHDRAGRDVKLLPTLRGAFCLTFMDEHTLYAARDPHGIRPLCLGRLDRGTADGCTVRIARRVQRVLVHERQAERTAQARQQLHRGLLDRAVGRGVREQRTHDVRVRRRGTRTLLVDKTGLPRALREFGRVDEVAVVAERDTGAGGGGAEDRLRVLPRGRAGRRVTAVADGDVPRHGAQGLLVEHLADQTEVLEHQHLRAVGDGDTGGLLAAVLEGVEPVVRQLGNVLARRPDTEDAALFARFVLVLVWCGRSEKIPTVDRQFGTSHGKRSLRGFGAGGRAPF
ncbi:hypothetical protein GTG23_30825 [Rhodococcus hoagii]|nr:hypothetical protein [Prescottella equi]